MILSTALLARLTSSEEDRVHQLKRTALRRAGLLYE